MAEAGWLGIAMPEDYGGSGLGITEAAIMLQAVAESGAGFAGASALHMNIFGPKPVVKFGTEEQKQRFLPPLIRGEEKACFGVTEPDAGLDTTTPRRARCATATRYVVHGQKIWTSTAQVAERCCCSRAPRRSSRSRSRPQGLSLFYTALDRATSRRARSTRWAARRSTPTSCSSTACPCRSRTASARKAAASTTCCTA